MQKIVFFLATALTIMGCSSKGPQKKIAIVTPATHPSLQQIERGFEETLEAAHPGEYQFVVYNGQGSKLLLQSEIEDVAQKDFALVCTLGTSSSKMGKEILQKRGSSVPLVFTCVYDPKAMGLVGSAEHPITGVEELVDFGQEIEAMLTYKPSIQTLLVVYNPSETGRLEDVAQVRLAAKAKGIEIFPIEVYQSNEIYAKVSPHMGQGDALLVLKDNTVVGALDVLVKLCNREKIPLIASDLDSPDRGAFLGYGVEEREFGVEAAKKALLILEGKAKPHEIPITPVEEFTVKVNAQAALAQGISLEEPAS